MIKRLFVAGLLITSFTAHSDSVRLSDGNSCSFDADDTPWSLEFEAKHIDKQEDGIEGSDKRWDDNNEYHVGATLKYKFGGPERLDCNKLYQIQLNTKAEELRLLKEKLKKLERSASINWDQ